jgi:hypothetical protein
MRVDLDGWKTIMRLGPKGVLEKVWDPKRDLANLPIWQSNQRICCSRFGRTSDVFKKKIPKNKCKSANIYFDKNRPEIHADNEVIRPLSMMMARIGPEMFVQECTCSHTGDMTFLPQQWVHSWR